MRESRVFAQTLSALWIAAFLAACSNSGPSGSITPSGVAPASQTRLAQSVGPSAVVEYAYVTNRVYNSVSAYSIDTTSGALTPLAGPPFRAGKNPYYVAVDPKGEFAYVANAGHSKSSGSVSAYTIDATSGTLRHVMGSPFGAGEYPDAMAVDPKGKFAYVANDGSGSVSAYAINATSGALTPVAGSPFEAGSYPQGLAVDPKGKFTYVPNFSSNNVSAYAINATSGALTPVAGSPFGAGTNPDGVTIDPKGKFAYIANQNFSTSGGSGSVSAYTINATSGALTPVAGSPFAAASEPVGVVVAPNGKFAYVADGGSNAVSAYAINASTGALTPVAGSPFGAGTDPVAVAVEPEGKFAYVTNASSSDVSAYTIDATSGALTPVAGSPFGGVALPFGITTCRRIGHRCIPPPL